MAKIMSFCIFLLTAAAFIVSCTSPSIPVSSGANSTETPADVNDQPASTPSAEEREAPFLPTESATEIIPPPFLFFYVSQKTPGAEVTDLKIARFNGQEIEVLSQHEDLGGIAQGVWSPDGRMIAFSECKATSTPQVEKIRILNRDGTETINLENRFQKMNARPYCATSISWSPDSKAIAFEGAFIDDWQDIFVASVEDERLENITKNLAEQYEKHPRCIGIDPNIAAQCQNDLARERTPLWSPDGSMIALTAVNDIYTVRLDDHALRKLTDSEESLIPLAWTPDSKRIIYTINGNSEMAFYSVTVEDGMVQRLGEGERPVLSPDGSQIAFSGSSGGIYVMDLDGKNLNKIVSSFAFEPHWTPDGNFIIYRESAFWIIAKDGGWKKELELKEPNEIWTIAVEGE